ARRRWPIARVRFATPKGTSSRRHSAHSSTCGGSRWAATSCSSGSAPIRPQSRGQATGECRAGRKRVVKKEETAMTEINRQILLVSRPQGAATADNFRLVETPLAPLADGQ